MFRLMMAVLLSLVVLTPFATHDALADSDERPTALMERISALEARVAQLEKLSPTFTTFMPNFSERFHVLHYAGHNGDWQVANHELLELQRLASVASAIDEQKGKLLQSFMAGPFHELQEAIEHGKQAPFTAALEQTVKSCNACHKAAGSPFIQVSLDVPSGLSMRHPHAFRNSSVKDMQHTH